MHKKIIDINNLKNIKQEGKKIAKKIVFCQGHFNVIHPGHLRFIEFAKKQGDILIIAVQGNGLINKQAKDIFFDEAERAMGVASLEKVDNVFIYEKEPLTEILEALNPDFYVMGEEFRDNDDTIKTQTQIVEKNGGKVLFSSGRVDYNTANILSADFKNLDKQNKEQLNTAIKKQKLSVEKIRNYLDDFKKLNILVIGDSIVDQYIACDALGMSAEAPVLNIREIESKEFVGGAAVVSRHIKALGANCSFVSVIGEDSAGKLVEDELKTEGIATFLPKEAGRQTIFKIRYMVDNQKLLRVSRLEDYHIAKQTEENILNYVKENAQNLDGIVVSDFSYGIITPTLVDGLVKIASRHNIKLFGDSQSSSQMGDVAKFVGFDLITPTEKEARLALNDKFNGLEKIGLNLLEKTGAKNLVLTMAERGFIAFENVSTDELTLAKSQHFPALELNPLDVVGAGDSMLSGYTLAMCAGASLMESSIIASAVASIAVNKVGNIPVRHEELEAGINGLMEKVEDKIKL